ncbi:MAG: C40 family peptidase [Bacteroidales bacterium]|nr:C40 family peptidase [Bacteroidales bacterium]
MGFGICNLSIVPVRLEASDKSEMVTQLLFGDLIVINKTQNTWLHIRMVYDNYEGWIDHKQILNLSEESFQTIANLPAYVTHDVVHVLDCNNKRAMTPVVLGSTMPYLVDKSFYLNNDIFFYDGQVLDPEQEPDREKIIDFSLLYLNTPYLWGGRSPFGIDCSGFTQIVYKLVGIKILRDASQQSTHGETLNFISEAKAGDLIFFDNDDGKIIHVGIYLGKNKIIHASGKVRIDDVDHNGIYNHELKKYTHKLRLIKCLL